MPDDKPSDPADKDSGSDQFQQVNRRAGYGDKEARIERILRWARKGATLAAGEGALIVEHYEALLTTLTEELSACRVAAFTRSQNNDR